MHIELTTGNDSFRAQGVSNKRNVRVNSFVRVDSDGEGRQVVPLFAAYQKKLKGFRETSLIATMPATTTFTANVAGNWFRNRHEVRQGTEILLEYRKRADKGFGEEIEYLLIVADEDAPLWQVRIDLPRHHHAAVGNVTFEGRFEIIREDKQLSKEAEKVWRAFFDLEKEFNVSDILDPSQEERIYKEIQLEGRVRSTKARVAVERDGEKKRVRIRRTRAIRTK